MAITTKTLRWFVFITVFLLLNAFVSYQNLRTLSTNYGLVARSTQIMALLDSTFSAVQDAETSQRGFLITNQASYLAPYTAAAANIDPQLDSLGALLADDQSQQQRLRSLREQVQAKFAELQETIDLQRAQGYDAARAVVLSNRGQASMNAIRALIGQIQSVEQAQREQRVAEVATSRLITFGTLVIQLGAELLLLFVVGYVLNRDLQARQRAVHEARVQREWFEVTLASIGDAVIATDNHGLVTFMNGTAEELTGWKHADAAGHAIDDVFRIINQQTRHMVENPVAKVLRDGVMVGLANHTMLLAKTGAATPIDDSGAPIRDRNGMIRGAVLVFRNISEQRRAEEEQHLLSDATALLATSLEYDLLLPQVAQLVVPLGADWCSIHLRGVVGAADQVISVPETAPPDAARLDAVAQVFASAEPIEQATQIIVPLHARQRTIGVLAVGYASERRADAGTSALIHELARRMALAVDNAMLYHESQAAVRHRDVFLSIASHELKTPLTALLGQAQLLQRRLQRDDPDDRNARTVGVIVAQSMRLDRMIGVLLDMSRIEQDRLTLDCTIFDLRPFIQRIVDEMLPTLRQHTIALTADAKPVYVNADPLRLEQVLQNVLGNAVKYAPSGGQIVVHVAQDDAVAWVSVRDEGIGIPAAALPQLFQRYYRASNVNADHISGLGIGLFLVKEIMMLHGGSVKAESVEGHGSTFTVSLPLAQLPVLPPQHESYGTGS